MNDTRRGGPADASLVDQRRVCAWCRGPIPAPARRDALCCSVSCRQARHRFTRGVGVGSGSATEPLRLAYADPPYPGLSARYYSDHPDFRGEVDHGALIRRLSTYDGWALSTSAAALPQVLALCPAGVRVAAWVKGGRAVHAHRPTSSWEPVIYFGGRAVAPAGDTRRADPRDASRVAGGDASRPPATRLDSLVHPPAPRTTDPARVVGAKPAPFCRWVFDLLGALPGDDFSDLFPGSGAVSRAWDTYVQATAEARSPG